MLSNLFDIKGPLLQQAITDYSTAYVQQASTEEKLFPPTLSLLTKLRNAGFLLAIATGKSQHGAENASARLGLTPYFDTIHGIVPGTPGKPDPAIIFRVMKALNVHPSQCLMVGDTTFDIDLAHAAGVHTIAVNWGVHSEQLLKSRKPKFFAKNFEELQHHLLQHSP